MPPLTLNMIRRARPCEDGWRKLLAHLGTTGADDKPISLATILDSNGLDDALWCLRALPDDWDNRCRLLACDFAEPALAFVPEGENRPWQAIAVARRYAVGDATQSELDAARAAAMAAAWGAARDAARDRSDGHMAWFSDAEVPDGKSVTIRIVSGMM